MAAYSYEFKKKVVDAYLCKGSIINAYDIKIGRSRAKLPRLIDAENE